MMRTTGKKISLMKYVETEEVITKEKITSILQTPDEKTIRINIAMINDKDEIVDERVSIISDENYELIFSESNIFDEGKNEGTYRDVDLWKMIDFIDQRKNEQVS